MRDWKALQQWPNGVCRIGRYWWIAHESTYSSSSKLFAISGTVAQHVGFALPNYRKLTTRYVCHNFCIQSVLVCTKSLLLPNQLYSVAYWLLVADPIGGPCRHPDRVVCRSPQVLLLLSLEAAVFIAFSSIGASWL